MSAAIALAALSEHAKTAAAAEAEADATLAGLARAVGGTLPAEFPFTAAHVRALVRSAFFAGANHECERRKDAR